MGSLPVQGGQQEEEDGDQSKEAPGWGGGEDRVSGYVGEEKWFLPPHLPPHRDLSPAYLPSEVMTLAGRRCLGWRGSKGRCDRGLGPTPA